MFFPGKKNHLGALTITSKSFMKRYSPMMALDFLSTSSSDNAGEEFVVEKHLCFAVGCGQTQVRLFCFHFVHN